MVIVDICDLHTKRLRRASVLISNTEASYVRFLTHRRTLELMNVETNKGYRKNGYASMLIDYLIRTYGGIYDIKLKCMPFGIEIDKTYKNKQEELAKFYEKFGFVTESREEYSDCYQWLMIWKRA